VTVAKGDEEFCGSGGFAINRREIPPLRSAARSHERSWKKKPRRSGQNDRPGLLGDLVAKIRWREMTASSEKRYE
jgi:hypothetical protein